VRLARIKGYGKILDNSDNTRLTQLLYAEIKIVLDWACVNSYNVRSNNILRAIALAMHVSRVEK